jgi:hypothetical protein
MLQMTAEESATYDRGDAIECDELRRALRDRARTMAADLRSPIEVYHAQAFVWFVVESQ